ncbi:ROK family transcriptional regulator [Phytomonospora endophytica]|uniref:ROK family transcriptional regulator n=1 Tax=Phytomonospora endophytica TaxID=714109 RepID=UPI001619A867|nr:ROK family transcriptional regulator [Phytomonospora endophytica]GIG69530.1 transcriptional regulator [Phytomonospora endophytica]
MRRNSGGDASLLRRLNTVAVLRVLHVAGPLTLTEVAARATVSRPTAEDAVADLLNRGLVRESAPYEGPRVVGRPARRYEFNADAGYALGIDVGAHKILAVVSDLGGDVRATFRTDVDPELAAPDRLAAMRAALRAVAAEAGVNLSDVRALGVGTSGIVDPTGKVTLSGHLPGWTGTHLPTELSGIVPGRVVVANDSNLAALGEHWRGVARGVDDVVYVLAGRRISAGILLGGRVHTGRHGAAGEIGIMRSMGWYDTARLLRDGHASSEELVNRLAAGVAATVLTIDPEVVIIGGGLSQAGDALIEPLRIKLADLCLYPVKVEASTLADRSVALGAIRLALDEVERELFDLG